MGDTLRSTLADWADFYLITGTAAAALTGLQFIVQTLLASASLVPVRGADPEGGVQAFGTPTVVHFSLALFVSAVLCAPWTGYLGLRATLAVTATSALVYSTVVFRRARQQRAYTPTGEDWLWHIVLPPIAYGTILLAAAFAGSGSQAPLFAVAAATLLLLGVGIHNAWDTVTYLTIAALRAADALDESAPPRRGDAATRGRRRR